jgi:UDP-4-amino-4,6-dideoxy-N-acetyl-beta-L-altrosamine transaminase
MMIPYARQCISEEDILAVSEVLRSDFLTQGPVVPRFEKEVSAYCGAQYGVAVNSATSALHLLCMAFDLGPGDWLWTSPITFVASANCALYCGAQVDFVDIDPQTGNLCSKVLEEKLVLAERQGKLPKIVIPVHYTGQSCDMEPIFKLSQRYGFKIIEDASHAIGGSYKGVKIGSCNYSDATVFSFHPVKIITTGEGGMVVTNNASLAERVKLLSSHGITRKPELMHHQNQGAWYYEQLDLGYNYRLSDIHAALGLSQLEKIDSFIEQRHKLVNEYVHLLSHLPITLPKETQENYSAWHLYVVQLELDHLKRSRREVFDSLRTQGIGVNVHYIPVYWQPYYKKLGYERGYCSVAEQFYERILSLPLYVNLSDEDVHTVSVAVHRALEKD